MPYVGFARVDPADLEGAQWQNELHEQSHPVDRAPYFPAGGSNFKPGKRSRMRGRWGPFAERIDPGQDGRNWG